MTKPVRSHIALSQIEILALSARAGTQRKYMIYIAHTAAGEKEYLRMN